jgi:hypothetical protein
MIRADYCGDGQPHTQDGTEIDVADGIGLESRVSASYGFEAEWDPFGAPCISQLRYAGQDPGGSGMTVGDYISKNCTNPWNRTIGVDTTCGSSSDLVYRTNASIFDGTLIPKAHTMNWSSTVH